MGFAENRETRSLPELDPDRSSFLPEISKGLAQEERRTCAGLASPTAPPLFPCT